MKWITRERPKIDRIACPWLIANFIDREAEFFYVPYKEVLPKSKKLKAIPLDIPEVKFSHHGNLCTFDALIKKYKILLLEKIIANKGLHSFLDGVTASVIGLIAITAIRLLLTNITSLEAIIIFSIALLLFIKFRSKYTVIFIILGAGLFNLSWHYV